MARKRMFDNDIINQDDFLELPSEAKALYFLLGMEADDEGFIAPKKILRLHNINADNLKILIAKQYLIPFKSGVVVITDWRRNNYLNKNKIKPTIYVDELKLLTFDTEKQKYVKTIDTEELNQSLTKVKQKLAQYRVEESSIEESRVVESSIETSDSCVDGSFLPARSDSCVDGFDKVIDFYNNNIGLLTPYGLELLESYSKEMDNNVIVYALKLACEANVRNLNYIKAILNDWSKQGIRTLIEAQKENKARKDKENPATNETEAERLARRTRELEEAIKRNETR